MTKMKCIFVFIFAVLIPTVLAETLQQERKHVVKRASNQQTGRWIKANSSPVCFGFKNQQFGRFEAPSSGNLAAIKLVHLYGYVSCDVRDDSHWSHWGCGENTWNGADSYKMVNTVITTASNGVILPPSEFIALSSLKWYKIPGYVSQSPELVLSVLSQPHQVTSGQELRLWSGEDLVDASEGDNGGTACCDVYALFV